jgi:hypothetical protein
VTVAWGDGRTTSLTYPAATTSWSMGIRYPEQIDACMRALVVLRPALD